MSHPHSVNIRVSVFVKEAGREWLGAPERARGLVTQTIAAYAGDDTLYLVPKGIGDRIASSKRSETISCIDAEIRVWFKNPLPDAQMIDAAQELIKNILTPIAELDHFMRSDNRRSLLPESRHLVEWRDRQAMEAEQRGEEMFMGIPDSWYEPATYLCPKGHVSSFVIKSETSGDICPCCHSSLVLGPPLTAQNWAPLAAEICAEDAP